MSKHIDAEKDARAAFLVGCLEGEERAVKKVLKIIDNFGYKPFKFDGNIYHIYKDRMWEHMKSELKARIVSSFKEDEDE